MKQNKIFLFGGPGFGKTHLASNLSKKYGYKNFSLDDYIYLDKKCQQKRSENIATMMLQKNINNVDRWIVEGGYLGWTDFVFKEADLTIILVVNPVKALGRISRRFVIDKEYGIISTIKLCTKTLPAYYKKEILGYPKKAGARHVININDSHIVNVEKALT